MWYCQRECSPMPVTHESFCSPRPSASASPYTVYKMCRFAYSVSSDCLLTSSDASCLTRCHLASVSYSCHFFRTRQTCTCDGYTSCSCRRAHACSIGTVFVTVTVDRGRCADQLDRRRGYARTAVG